MKDQGVEPLVEVAAFCWVEQAQIVKSRFAQEDIDCVLLNEHTIATNWLYSNLLGGVRLQVRQSDAVRAREILEEDAWPLLQGELKVYAPDGCPQCGTPIRDPRQSQRRRGAWALLLWYLPLVGDLFAHLPTPTSTKAGKCPNCGHEFSGESKTG